MGGGKDGKGFVTVVDANARNKIVYPGSFSDADFYSKQFGEIIENEIRQTKAYDTVGGMKGLFSNKISESMTSTRRARFTPEDIVFRPFGEITYCLIKNNSIQTPGVSKIQYIPRELNEKLDAMVAEYNAEQLRKIEEKELRENGGLVEDNTSTATTETKSTTTENTVSNNTSADNDSEGFIDISMNDSEVENESYDAQSYNSQDYTSQDDFSSDDIDILGMFDDEEDL